jgi:hypothetical protein
MSDAVFGRTPPDTPSRPLLESMVCGDRDVAFAIVSYERGQAAKALVETERADVAA